jgi:hypothetical protein
MTSRTYRRLGIGVLVMFVLLSAYGAFISIAADYIVWDIFEGGSILSFRLKLDSWFFLAVFLVIAAATIGIRMHRRWARTAALCSLAGLSVWAAVSALLPRTVVDGLFFFHPDRWLAWVLAALTATAFVWLRSSRARMEFQGNGIKA